MNTFELLQELSKKSKEEIEFCIVPLMLSNKIDYVTISNSYIRALNIIKDDRAAQIHEAETCAIELLDFPRRKKNKLNDYDNRIVQRALYLLNQGKRFNMQKINEQFGYDEEFAKTLSWYERNRNRNL